MSSDLHEKRAGDEPFESETEIEEAAGEGKGIFGTLHKPVWGEYCEDDLAGMVVRGLQFMSDKKKIDCGPPLFKLMHADIFKTRKEDERMSHFASRKESWAYQRWEKQQQHHKKSHNNHHAHPHASAPQQATAALSSHPLAPLFVINFLIPGAGFNMNLVLYFARRVRPAAELKKLAAERKAKGLAPLPAPLPHQNSVELKDKAVKHPPHVTAKKDGNSHSHYEGEEFPHDIERIAAFDLLLERFLTGDDEFRDCRLKIVPRIAEGSWVVKKSIGRVPAILGKKVKQFYYRDTEKNYIEIDADLGTSMVAGRIISMVKGTCKGMVVDLSFLLQGEGKDELPESLLGGIRMIRVDLDKITFLDENNAKNPPEFDF